MALCLADSILQCNGFLPSDARLRFHNWVGAFMYQCDPCIRGVQWYFGYRNPFGFDGSRTSGEGRQSLGLGGTMKDAFKEFITGQTNYTTVGNEWVALCACNCCIDISPVRAAGIAECHAAAEQ
jgi:hypothetical protein